MISQEEIDEIIDWVNRNIYEESEPIALCINENEYNLMIKSIEGKPRFINDN